MMSISDNDGSYPNLELEHCLRPVRGSILLTGWPAVGLVRQALVRKSIPTEEGRIWDTNSGLSS